MSTTASANVLLRKADDFLVAPNASGGERLATYGGALAGTVLALTLALAADGDLGVWPLVVVGVVAFDAFGGAVANATTSAKRWWHRPGTTARGHFAFVATHVQPFVLAWAVPGFGWTTAAAVYGLVVAGAVAVLVAPAAVRRPVAFAAATLALTVLTTVPDIPRELLWFAPVLLIKLLLSHLLPESAGPGVGS